MSEVKACELLPCPFCGGEPHLMFNVKDKYHWFMCSKCGIETPSTWSSKAEAISAWNTRQQGGESLCHNCDTICVSRCERHTVPAKGVVLTEEETELALLLCRRELHRNTANMPTQKAIDALITKLSEAK